MSIQNIVNTTFDFKDDAEDTISQLGSGGLTLITSALTTPIQTIISGGGFDTGGAQVSFTNLYNLKLATPALRIPATNNVFLLENSVQVEDETTLPTRMGALTAVAGLDTKLILKADTGGVVWEEVDLTQNGLTYTDLTGATTTATWTSILAGGGATPNIEQVLIAGANANGQSITGLNDVGLTTINGSAYPPSVATPNLDAVLSTLNNAGANNIDMNGQQIINCSNINTTQINGSSITTIGLNWGDFTGNNAFTNLPSNAYSVNNYSGLHTDQTCDAFRATNNNINGYNELTATGMEIVDIPSSTSTFYQSNNLTINNGTAYTITQSSGQNVNVNCGQFVVNGVPFKVPIYYETHTNSNFSISSGMFQAIGSPFTWGGLIPNQNYLASIQFSMSCDTYESSSSVYLDYSNSSGSWSSNTYSSSSYPCPQTGSNTTFSGASGYSCFTIIDSIQFTADSFGQLNIQLYAGHGGGFWNTNYRWTFIGTILS